MKTENPTAKFVPRIRRGPDLDFDWAIQIRPGRWQKTSGFHWHTCEEADVTGPGWLELTVTAAELGLDRPTLGGCYDLDGETVTVLAVTPATYVVEHPARDGCLGHVITAGRLKPVARQV